MIHQPLTSGTTFGRWTVIRRCEKPEHLKCGAAYYLCKCSCGAERQVKATSLVDGVSNSCGCLKSEVISACTTKRLTKHGHAKGTRRSKEYRAWWGIIKRCTYSTEDNWERYGGRGITVCQRWRDSFEAFLEDVGFAPSPKYTIGRIDNEGHYEPGNVAWQLPKEQSRNTRRNRFVTFNGETKVLSDWAEELGIKRATLERRLDRSGWSIERAFTTPVTSVN